MKRTVVKRAARAHRLAHQLVTRWERAVGQFGQPTVLGGDLCDPDTERMARDIAKLLLRGLK